ncbi:21990_t:CDS:2 [Racocetra persica]|uniref:21990_t:CDS:1 n=1 Tax=Racocetra persica TaxID=160502 RepID=A0ACA9KWX2_9GLOM|nr:21990_t:CDS:2 [Racocetra persica]
MSNMANLNPAAYTNGINLTNGIVGVQNAPRGLAHMHLAMGQTPHTLNPAMPQYGLGIPMLANMPAINNPRLQGQRQMALAQNPSPPISPQHSQGTCILRLFMFSEHLTNETSNKKDIGYWQRVVNEFFSEDGKFRYGLWNCHTTEKRMFDIPNPVISRFFQVNFESGVTSIQLTMSSIKENLSHPILINNGFAAPVSTVEAKASMIYNYEDGSRVVATGLLKVRFNYSIKIDIFEFTTEKHIEYVPRLINILPGSPIGEYGIPTKTLRSLEVAEGVVTLNDLITTVITSNKGPLQALSALANPEQKPQNIINQSNDTPLTPGPSPSEIPAKTPKEKVENTTTDNNTQQSTTNDVSVPSPSTSNAIAKQESPSVKPKSPILSGKRPSDPNVQKPKRTRTNQRKGSRQETGS